MIQDYNFPGKQLASLSLLLSEAVPRPFVNPKTGQSYDVAIAEIVAILTAVREWKARGDSSPDNRLIFYFCGHGISESEDVALLAADFNGDDDNPLNQALDLRKLMLGLNRCQASEQVFFIDACRSSSDTLLSRSGMYAGQVPFLPASGRPNGRDGYRCRTTPRWPARCLMRSRTGSACSPMPCCAACAAWAATIPRTTSGGSVPAACRRRSTTS